MSEPYMKCPCGFEARTANAHEAFVEHTCPKPPMNWPAAVTTTVVLLGLFSMIVLVVAAM